MIGQHQPTWPATNMIHQSSHGSGCTGLWWLGGEDEVEGPALCGMWWNHCIIYIDVMDVEIGYSMISRSIINNHQYYMIYDHQDIEFRVYNVWCHATNDLFVLCWYVLPVSTARQLKQAAQTGANYGGYGSWLAWLPCIFPSQEQDI